MLSQHRTVAPPDGPRNTGHAHDDGMMAALGASEPEEAELQIRRRREAALRLPPLPCGHRDPESPEHLAGRCRYRASAA